MRVLVSGAGIAGLAVATLLARRGHEVSVLELSPTLPAGGQTIDLRGSSATVLEGLGLLGRAREHLLDQRGIAWVDAAGRRVAQSGVEALGGQGLVSSSELLRSDLARVLCEAALAAGVDVRFAESVTGLRQDDAGALVTTTARQESRYALVVAADGSHSRVRSLVFGPEEQLTRPLRLAHAWFTAPAQAVGGPPLEGWWLVHKAPGARVTSVRPGHPGQVNTGFTLPAAGLPSRHDRAAQLAHLDTMFTDVGWVAPELLRAARTADDLSLDVLHQVHVPRWSSGSVVLLGDAAWCSSPLSGLGTALALRGASELAAAVERSERWTTTAAETFEAAMRPVVTSAQRLLPGRVPILAPRTALGVRASLLLTRALTTQPLAGALDWLVAHRPAEAQP